MFGRVPDEGLHGSCLRFPLDSKWIYSAFDLSTKRFKISCVSCAAKGPCPFHGGVANSRLQTRYIEDRKATIRVPYACAAFCVFCYSLLTAETWAFGLDTFGFGWAQRAQRAQRTVNGGPSMLSFTQLPRHHALTGMQPTTGLPGVES